MPNTIRSGNYYADQLFSDLQQEGVDVKAVTFQECSFVHCALGEIIFRNCRFVDCTFLECDLSLAGVPGSVFSAVRFDACKLIGVDWTQADWDTVRLGRPFDFYNCTLNHATFIGLDLSSIQFKDCLAVDVDFRESTLAKACFGGTDLDQSLFANTDLSHADFRGARNYLINPAANKLKRARFALPEAMALLYAMDIMLTEGDHG